MEPRDRSGSSSGCSLCSWSCCPVSNDRAPRPLATPGWTFQRARKSRVILLIHRQENGQLPGAAACPLHRH
jgi:hypothetical protein